MNESLGMKLRKKNLESEIGSEIIRDESLEKAYNSIIDDFILHCGPKIANKIREKFHPQIIQYIKNNPDLPKNPNELLLFSSLIEPGINRFREVLQNSEFNIFSDSASDLLFSSLEVLAENLVYKISENGHDEFSLVVDTRIDSRKVGSRKKLTVNILGNPITEGWMTKQFANINYYSIVSPNCYFHNCNVLFNNECQKFPDGLNSKFYFKSYLDDPRIISSKVIPRGFFNNIANGTAKLYNGVTATKRTTSTYNFYDSEKYEGIVRDISRFITSELYGVTYDINTRVKRRRMNLLDENNSIIKSRNIYTPEIYIGGK
ncbi:MAG TPA: hypothetical protein VEC16_02275 [Alphaproteobacteria bacterium]|nr:hypothetical protein [Alphaproteobacteria bacterium]